MKIIIIGARNVGTSVAYALIMREFTKEVVLIDTNDDLLLVKELEPSQSITALNLDIELICIKEHSHTQNSRIILLTAGLARKDGQSKDGLLQINANIMLDRAKRVKRFNKESLFIILTNLVDFLLNILYRSGTFNAKKTVAMAGVLDNVRFKYELAKRLKVKTSSADTRLMDFHNDDMVLLKSHSSVGNCKLIEFLNEEELEDAEDEVKTGGVKAIKHLKNSAYLAPASVCLRMFEAVRPGEFLPMSVILDGEFGVKNKAFGVTARLGLESVREIMCLALAQEEQEELEKSLIKYQYKGE